MASSKKSKNRPARGLPEKTAAAEERRDALARYDETGDVLARCLERVTADDAGSYVENPAIEFTQKVKDGRFDNLSDEEYDARLRKVEKLSTLWHKQPRRTAGEILLALLERITIPRDRIEDISGQLMEWYDPEDGCLDEHGNPCSPSGDEAEAKAAIDAAFASKRPAEIRNMIAGRVIGQENAVKAAAVIVYNQLAGRRTNAVFCGPSGSGKTEIWRVAARQFPGLIRMMDFSRFTAEGWRGTQHISDIFSGLDPDNLRRTGLIVVLDEADKVLCEHAMGAGGTDYHLLLQNDLLKMLDGDVIEFGAHDGKPAMAIDCANVSVVMLGAFETLLAGKAGDARHIGFGAAPGTGDPGSHGNISYDDLIKAGTRREIAGRINRIVALDPLGAAGYREIIKGPALSGLEEDFKCPIVIDDAAADMLSQKAVESGLGVRWAKSAMRNAIDDAMFDMAGAEEYRIGVCGGVLRCTAARRKTPDSGEAHAETRMAAFDFDEPLPF